MNYIEEIKEFLDAVKMQATAHVESGDMMMANQGRVFLGFADILSVVISGQPISNRPLVDGIENDIAEKE